MFDWFKPPPVQYIPSDRELILSLLRRIKAMALDVSKLNDAIAKVSADVDTLIAAHTDPTVQTAIDTATAAVLAVATKAEAAVTPAPAV